MLVAMGLLSGCGTVMRGSKDAWAIDSIPQGARVALNDGRGCDSTPCSIRVPRRSVFIATLSKPGFVPKRIVVTHAMGYGGYVSMFGNELICCGLLGLAVDAATGSGQELTPNPAFVRLDRERADPPPAPPPQTPAPGRYRGPCIRVPTDPSQSTC